MGLAAVAPAWYKHAKSYWERALARSTHDTRAVYYLSCPAQKPDAAEKHWVLMTERPGPLPFTARCGLCGEVRITETPLEGWVSPGEAAQGWSLDEPRN